MNQDIRILEYDCLDSTSRLLMDMAREGEPCGTAVWAHTQTGGRGRLGRSFSSPEGGIYVSILLPLDQPSGSGILLTAKAGVAVRRTIMQVCGKDCSIKWVNDLIFNGKKVCGILAQACQDKAVLGIGVNLKTDIALLPEDVREIATSLYGVHDEVPDERAFVETLLDNVYSLVCTGDENWLEEYKSSSTIVGNKVLILRAGAVVGEGIATEIDDACALHVVGIDGNETVLSTGEVSIRKTDD